MRRTKRKSLKTNTKHYMKTIPQLISEIKIDPANLEHIAKTGKINGTLYNEIRDAIALFSLQEVIEALRLHGIVDPSTQNNKLDIQPVMGMLACDRCGCHPTVLYTTEKGRFCVSCKPAS